MNTDHIVAVAVTLIAAELAKLLLGKLLTRIGLNP